MAKQENAAPESRRLDCAGLRGLQISSVAEIPGAATPANSLLPLRPEAGIEAADSLPAARGGI